VDNSFLGLLLT